MNREQLFRYFFLGVFIFLFYQIFHVLSPFYTGILGAIVLTLIFFPLHRTLGKKIGQNCPNITATASTILVMARIVITFIFFSWILFNELTTIVPQVKRMGSTFTAWKEGGSVSSIPFLQIIQIRLEGILDIAETNLQEIVVGLLTGAVNWITASLKSLPKNAFALFINILVMLFTMFFLFRDGP
ncbi:MAG: hypothetical protein Q8Q91_03175, partial [Candidatus Daviesbacteria bacterium]|nr:hypothetical protein [Candidatus Daviesbacteria bacterium]